VRILYFSRDYTSHDHRFLDALADAGHEVHYLRLENVQTSESRSLPEGIQQINCWVDQKRVGLIDAPRLILDLRRVLHEMQPDLVHAGPVQRSALLTALTGFHPLVTMSWGSDMLVEGQRGPGSWAARYTLSHSDVFVCDCQTVRKAAVQLGMPDDRIVVFPWGVDLDHFSPGDEGGLRARLGWEQAFVLLSTRAWEPIYGVDMLVCGFISATQLEPNLRLLMLSQGSLQSKIEGLLREAGIQDRVYFAGQVGYSDLPMYYRAADLYVSATHSDGSSVSLMEALACGCPALVSNIPGNQEWIYPGEHGWWFGDGEIKDLCDGILVAAEENERLLEMSQSVRKLAERRADWTKNSQELLRAYEMAVFRK